MYGDALQGSRHWLLPRHLGRVSIAPPSCLVCTQVVQVCCAGEGLFAAIRGGLGRHMQWLLSRETALQSAAWVMLLWFWGWLVLGAPVYRVCGSSSTAATAASVLCAGQVLAHAGAVACGLDHSLLPHLAEVFVSGLWLNNLGLCVHIDTARGVPIDQELTRLGSGAYGKAQSCVPSICIFGARGDSLERSCWVTHTQGLRPTWELSAAGGVGGSCLSLAGCGANPHVTLLVAW